MHIFFPTKHHFSARLNLSILSHAGDTTLHLAARRGHQQVVRLLLDRGSNPEAENSQGGSREALLLGLHSMVDGDPLHETIYIPSNHI